MAEIITSSQNNFVKKLRELNDRKVRDTHRKLLAEGPKLVEEALKEGLTPFEALIEESRLSSLADTAHALSDKGAEVKLCSAQVLRSIGETRTPQGIAVSFSMPAPFDIKKEPSLIAALDGVQDPGNVGGIWRTADAAGFGAVLFSDGCADPMSPKVIRSAMGSAFRLPALCSTDFVQDLITLRERGFRIIVSALDGEDFFTAMPGKNEKCVLVIGSEGHGIRPSVRECATDVLRLPMQGGAESLNANVAAGIMLYSLSFELRRG